jgi:hypothetical protein
MPEMQKVQMSAGYAGALVAVTFISVSRVTFISLEERN